MPRLLSLLVLLVLLTLPPTTASAQTGPEYRALWVETFNTPLGTRADIDKVIAAAVDGNLNAIFAQVRRRGDSWYLDTLEPLTQVTGVGEPDASGRWTFDPLQYLIDQAHLRQIEVHAFVIVGAIANAAPASAPKDPNHVFNTHVWNKATGAVYPVGDSRQWATRGLPHSTFIAAGSPPAVTSFDGQRFASEWYVDLGHPDASAYTVEVLTHLIRKYAIDGLHLDRIRYPEAPIDKPSAALATWGVNVGYNETSVNRFKARYGSAATYYASADLGTNVNPAGTGGAPPAIIGAGDLGYPRTNDALWNSWRREQVTNFVRRLYLNATAANPRIKISAATICFWTGPVASGGWERTEAYYRVFQDWRAWMQEGTLDIAAPMIYKREHSATERPQYDDWLSFTKTLAQSSGRQAIAGLGAYLNGVEGTLRQARKALARAPFDSGYAPGDGLIFYALGSTVPNTLTGNSTNAAILSTPFNPFSYPTPNLPTPKRTNAQFFSALRTGAAGTTLFEDPGFGPLFATTAPVPDMPWKSAPALGHVMGFGKHAGTPLDGAFVTVRSLNDPVATPRVVRTDGGGFYGAVGLAPGAYKAAIELGAVRLDVCRFDVAAGLVTTASEATADAVAPVTSSSVTGPVGENAWYTGDAVVTFAASDDCSGVSFTEYSTDGGTTWIRYSGPVTISTEGSTSLSYRSVDEAGNVESSSTIALKIDKTAPVLTLFADRAEIWPPNGNLEPIALTGTASDASSGLVSVVYMVVDEYGGTFAIDPRALSGASAEWTDSVALEARRDGFDLDGRLYRIVATVRDAAGLSASTTVQVVVLHDRR